MKAGKENEVFFDQLNKKHNTMFKKFDENSQGGSFQRQLVDVSGMNIKCRDCAAPITQLPFDPDPSRLDSIRCRDCLRKFREQRPPRRF